MKLYLRIYWIYELGFLQIANLAIIILVLLKEFEII